MKMQMQEQFFKEQIKLLHDKRDEKEENFERLQQEEREKMKQTNGSRSNTDEYRNRYSDSCLPNSNIGKTMVCLRKTVLQISCSFP